MLPEPQYEVSVQGNLMIRVDGYRFLRHKNLSGGRIRWKCAGYTTHGCLASLHTLADDERIIIIKHINKHTHTLHSRICYRQNDEFCPPHFDNISNRFI